MTSKTLTYLFSICFIAILTNCGGGGSEPTPPSNQPTNQTPNAKTQSLSVDQDNVLSIELSGTDPDGTINQYKISQQPNNGTLAGSNENWRYTPNQGFSGQDSFAFTVTDNQGLISKAATINIEVAAIQVIENNAPTASTQSLDMQQQDTLSIVLSGTDTDGSIAKFNITEQPQHGTLTGSQANWQYQPEAGFTGTDNFSFTITDDQEAISNEAMITIKVNPIDGSFIYVSTNGSNSNSGQSNSPYLTINHAIEQAESGDVILVGAGTYREEVVINGKSNITIKNGDSDPAIISGADIVTGPWQEDTSRSGVFFTSLERDSIETSYTQVFVNDKFQQMARFPDNKSGKMLEPMNPESGYALITNASKPAGSSARATVEFTTHGGVSSLPNVEFSNEAVIRGLIGKLRNNIFSASTNGAAIQKENASEVSFIGTNNGPWKGESAYDLPEGFGYIFDLSVLDKEGEWFFKRGENQLYYKPAGGTMAGKIVEAKKRKWAIRISDSNHITLNNIHVKSASVKVDNSDNLHVTNSSFQYLLPFLYRTGYGVLKEGIIINNSDNGLYENNLIAHTWGSGLIINSGHNNTIHNNIIEDIGWLGQFTVSIFNEGENTKITQNTFGRASRFHIRTTAPVKSTITDNHMFEAMSMGEDAGPIMMTSTAKTEYLDLKDTVIAYNKIHDVFGIPAMDTKPNYNRQTVKAFYLEDVDNYTVHHNLVYNITGSGYTRKTSGTAVAPDGSILYLGPRTRSMDNKLNYFNNTFYNYDSFMGIWHHSATNQDIQGLIANGHFKNNIMLANKKHSLNGTYVTITLPNHSTNATGSISKIEEMSLADFSQEIAKAPYNYTINHSNNSELTTAEFALHFENPATADFKLKQDSELKTNGEAIDGITGTAPIARGAWEGSSAHDQNRVFRAGASINRDDFPSSL